MIKSAISDKVTCAERTTPGHVDSHIGPQEIINGSSHSITVDAEVMHIPSLRQGSNTEQENIYFHTKTSALVQQFTLTIMPVQKRVSRKC